MKNMLKVVALGAVVMGLSLHAEEITVGGTGVVKAQPDRIAMRFEVATLDGDMAAGMAKLVQNNAAISVALGEVGVEPSEIKVSQISLNPQYKYSSSSGRSLEGYRQSCNFTIDIPLDMLRMQKIYRAIVATKCGEEINLSFYIKNEKPYRTEAKKRAVADARESAETLAAAAGVSLGKVEEISYNAGSIQPLRRNVMLAKAVGFAADEANGLGLVSNDLNDITLTESVVITWQIKE